MNKRSIANLSMWGIFATVLTILSWGYIFVGHAMEIKIIGSLLSALAAWFLVVIVNAWIFNGLFKKYFDKFFGE